MMLELSRAVQRVLIRPEVSGVVVTQPADNIEETAYFVSISLSDVFQNQNSKPIVFTTCMNPEDPMFDGTKNLLDSIRVACHDVKGDISTVVVCMNGEIHAASRAQLIHTNKASALASPGWPRRLCRPRQCLFPLRCIRARYRFELPDAQKAYGQSSCC